MFVGKTLARKVLIVLSKKGIIKVALVSTTPVMEELLVVMEMCVTFWSTFPVVARLIALLIITVLETRFMQRLPALEVAQEVIAWKIALMNII